MGIEVLVSLVSGMVSLGAGGLVANDVIRKLVRRLLKVPEQPEKPYSERLAKLTAGLTDC